jgi:phosphopentomutase
MERQRPWAVFTAYAVFLVTAFPERVAAQQHLVPLDELHQRLRQSGESRARDTADIGRVLSLPAARDAMRKANVDPARVQVALSVLSDQELSRLADRARAAEQDVQGGLIVGLLALIGLIVVILIVVSAVK